MKTAFRSSFTRDLKKLRDVSMRRRIKTVIEQVESAHNLTEIPHLTKISGASGYYRIRVGDYRIGIVASEDEIEFVRCLHRRDIYRYFP